MSWEVRKTGLPPGTFATRLVTATSLLSSFAAGSAYDIASHIARRSKANAPIRTELLRSSIESTVPASVEGGFECVVKVRDDALSTKNTVSGATLSYYLPRMYYWLVPYGDFPMYHLGDLSADQPDTPEGGVGGKWLSRVVSFHDAEYLRQMVTAVAKLFEKGRLPLPLHFKS